MLAQLLAWCSCFHQRLYCQRSSHVDLLSSLSGCSRALFSKRCKIQRANVLMPLSPIWTLSLSTRLSSYTYPIAMHRRSSARSFRSSMCRHHQAIAPTPQKPLPHLAVAKPQSRSHHAHHQERTPGQHHPSHTSMIAPPAKAELLHAYKQQNHSRRHGQQVARGARLDRERAPGE